ncbi:MAG: recombination mediator RecR [Bacteriovoracaceae bacterium]|nr:recombination mediator RecR [Bacteriovoracaceae bacterium]
MIDLPQVVKEAVSVLGKLPGVGEKSALRMVTAMTKWRLEDLQKFSKATGSLVNLNECEECGMWTDEKICSLCLDPKRADANVLCVVEQVSDLLAIEKSGQFKGRFLVLGGVLNPLLGIGPDQLRINKLLDIVGLHKTQVVVLALNPSIEGDATCAYIKHVLPNEISVERIGFGMPIGGSLEYLDPMTIGKALENRKSF